MSCGIIKVTITINTLMKSNENFNECGWKKIFFCFVYTLISKSTNLSTNFIASLNQTVCDGGRHIFFIHKNPNITIL